MNPQLDAYLNRIGYKNKPRPDYETLVGVHRAHLLSIPYENLEIHRGGYLSVDENAIIRKIVHEKRGGWCFEMNGLFARALKQIGFKVTLLASTVNRQPTGKTIEGNHLVLRVDLERPYLADVGFGNGFIEPLPLEEGAYPQGFLEYRLRPDGETWWFSNHAYGTAGYDFTLKGHHLSDFAPQSHELQTWTESGFVRLTVCQRFTNEGIATLRGAILHTVTQAGLHEQVLDSYATYQNALTDIFGLHLDDTEALWTKVWGRHSAWVEAQAQSNHA